MQSIACSLQTNEKELHALYIQKQEYVQSCNNLYAELRSLMHDRVGDSKRRLIPIPVGLDEEVCVDEDALVTMLCSISSTENEKSNEIAETLISSIATREESVYKQESTIFQYENKALELNQVFNEWRDVVIDLEDKCESNNTEIANIKRKVESLHSSIHTFKQQLNAASSYVIICGNDSNTMKSYHHIRRVLTDIKADLNYTTTTQILEVLGDCFGAKSSDHAIALTAVLGNSIYTSIVVQSRRDAIRVASLMRGKYQIYGTRIYILEEFMREINEISKVHKKLNKTAPIIPLYDCITFDKYCNITASNMNDACYMALKKMLYHLLNRWVLYDGVASQDIIANDSTFTSPHSYHIVTRDGCKFLYDGEIQSKPLYESLTSTMMMQGTAPRHENLKCDKESIEGMRSTIGILERQISMNEQSISHNQTLLQELQTEAFQLEKKMYDAKSKMSEAQEAVVNEKKVYSILLHSNQSLERQKQLIANEKESLNEIVIQRKQDHDNASRRRVVYETLYGPKRLNIIIDICNQIHDIKRKINECDLSLRWCLCIF